MSSSTVTYTFISYDSDLPPWGFHLMDLAEFEAPEEAPQSPEQAPPSPDYVPGPEHPPSPDYVPGDVADSDPLDEDPKEDPANYPADGGDDDEPFEVDDDEKEEEDEEEEHLASTDSGATTPPPPQTIIPVSMTRYHRARISVRPHTSPSPSTKALIAEYVSAPTPPSPSQSLLSPLSSPLPKIPSQPSHTSPT
nr:hypothetical protein [Tanacetum cinerariifolium]